MLPAANRMRSAADFAETTRRGKRVTCGSVIVYLDRQGGPGESAPACAGLIVGRSVGSSVVRHRVSRRIRGVLRTLVPGLPDGSRVVVRALPGAGQDRHLAASVARGLGELAGGG